MPPRSEAQRRLMRAAEAGKVKGIKPSVAKEFLSEDKPGRHLPKHVKAHKGKSKR